MAAVAPQPVMVSSPAGAPTSDCPIFLAANSGVVTATPCLDWQPAPAGPGGAARVQLKTFQAVKAFLPRCKISRIAADLAAADAVDMLTVRLTDAGWSRILTELSSAQVFSKTADSVDELHSLLKEANIPTPANLDLVAGDWRNAEAFALPGGASAAAIAARALLTPIRFLSLISAPSVEDPAAPLPLGLLSAIVGALGPCLTQAVRRIETSTVQLTASTLRVHLAATAPTDGLLAVKVAPFFKSKLLPFQLRGFGVHESSLREEFEDGIEYKRSDQGKRAIEEKRIHLLAAGRPNLDRFVILKSRDNLTALSCVRRLRVELLEVEKKDLDLVEVLDGPDGLERRLHDRRNILTEAEAQPGATAETITAALLDELRKIRSSGPAPRCHPWATAHQRRSTSPGSSRFLRAPTTPPFVRSHHGPQRPRPRHALGPARRAHHWATTASAWLTVRVLFSTAENGDLTRRAPPLYHRADAVGHRDDRRERRDAHGHGGQRRREYDPTLERGRPARARSIDASLLQLPQTVLQQDLAAGQIAPVRFLL